MRKKQVKQILIDNISILNYYGAEEQIPVWIEEMSELIKVLCKWQRHKGLNEQIFEDLKEEIADVTICLDQLKYAIGYCEDELMKEYKYKVDRQLQRISNEDRD